ncbi:hypothetical protein Q5P01_010830 [Channa striata]|uniref:Rhodanese domain-containing protein n=1 Tax=Channa striata TaxID=64152 RepID=A0AA88MSV0_CHASR|nr:hypothetical protein Q5P01_010830 [Channa striata]
MALGRWWRLAGVVPRLLWNSGVQPLASLPGGRSSVSGLVSTHTGFKSTELLLCRFSSGPPSADVTYEQLKQLLASRKAVVVDVREPWELREYGFIPWVIKRSSGTGEHCLPAVSRGVQRKVWQ